MKSFQKKRTSWEAFFLILQGIARVLQIKSLEFPEGLLLWLVVFTKN